METLPDIGKEKGAHPAIIANENSSKRSVHLQNLVSDMKAYFIFVSVKGNIMAIVSDLRLY
jgi:hypothetical protein